MRSGSSSRLPCSNSWRASSKPHMPLLQSQLDGPLPEVFTSQNHANWLLKNAFDIMRTASLHPELLPSAPSCHRDCTMRGHARHRFLLPPLLLLCDLPSPPCAMPSSSTTSSMMSTACRAEQHRWSAPMAWTCGEHHSARAAPDVCCAGKAALTQKTDPSPCSGCAPPGRSSGMRPIACGIPQCCPTACLRQSPVVSHQGWLASGSELHAFASSNVLTHVCTLCNIQSAQNTHLVPAGQLRRRCPRQTQTLP
jgi:hypothetical protein